MILDGLDVCGVENNHKLQNIINTMSGHWFTGARFSRLSTQTGPTFNRFETDGIYERLTMKHYVRNNQATHFIVVARRCEVYEPSWVVVREGSGQTAQSIAHFYNEFDAEEYAKHRNRIQAHIRTHTEPELVT